MLAFIDIHKHVFQACVLDPATGETTDQRFAAHHDALAAWANAHPALVTVAIEATTGWRWVCRDLQARGFDVRLVDPGQAKALQGKKRRAKTDKLDCRWGVQLLAKEMLPEAWLAPAQIQELRDKTRLRHALVRDRTNWALRLHAFLQHEGVAVSRARLLTVQGRRFAATVNLASVARAHIDVILSVIATLDEQIDVVERDLREFAKTDSRTAALMEIRGIGAILACVILAEIGDAHRFHRARQITRAAGLDPVVSDSADTKRRGHLAKAGSPQLRWALVEAASGWAGRIGSPDHELHHTTRQRLNAQNANLTVARKLGRRAYHVLRSVDPDQAAA